MSFQTNAFQETEFQLTVGTVTSTTILQLPINAVLAGEQLFRDRYKTSEIFPTNRREKTRASGSGVSRLSPEKPSFIVKSTAKGYD